MLDAEGDPGDLPFAQSRNLDFILNILPQTSLTSVHSVSDMFSNLLNIHSDMILVDLHPVACPVTRCQIYLCIF